MLNFLSCLYLKETVLVTHLCPTLWDLMDCSPGSSVHGISQARILEGVAISFSRGSSRPRDRTWVFHIVGRHFTVWATREFTILTISLHDSLLPHLVCVCVCVCDHFRVSDTLNSSAGNLLKTKTFSRTMNVTEFILQCIQIYITIPYYYLVSNLHSNVPNCFNHAIHH